MRYVILTALVVDLVVASLALGYKIAGSTKFGAVWIGAFAVLALFAVFCLVSLRFLESRRDRVVRTWMVLVSTTVTCLVVDLAAGFLLITPASPLILRDDVVHHRLAPNIVMNLEKSDFSTTFTTNRLGLRGAEISPAKAPGEYRILMLGDSFTMGKGVEDNETFSALLEERLSRAGSRRVQVMNAGVDSYTPLLAGLSLKDRHAQLDPDLVVLNLDMSDLVQEVAYRELARQDDRGEILAVPAPRGQAGFGGWIRNWVRDHLFLGRWAIYRIDRWESAAGATTVEALVELPDMRLLAHTLEADEVDRSAQWANLADSIKKIKTFCDTRGMQFLLTIYPWGHQVDDEEWVPGRDRFLPPDATVSDRSVRIIEQQAAAAGIELANAFPAFRARSDEEPIYFDDDMHWRPFGHRIMADALESHLRERLLESDEAR